MNRRSLLIQLLGLGAAGVATPSLARGSLARGSLARGSLAGRQGGLRDKAKPFEPLLGPIPLPTDGLTAAQQRHHYARIAIQDKLVVPKGYRSDLVLSWGDSLGSGRFGFNNDYLAFQPLTANRGVLTVNFEYISAKSWCAGFEEVMGFSLPFRALIDELSRRGGSVDVSSLPAGDALLSNVMAVARAALMDLGIGVATIERNAQGRWLHQSGELDRRITGLSGWKKAEEQLRTTGPAAAVFRRQQRMGYNDGLGDRVIGTFANCAGGQTPWGTVLSAEENFQNQVVEAVFADGSSPPPADCPFRFDGKRLEGLGNPFGMAGNKYGWMVEIDPLKPKQPPVKHTWLGRFRHEAVAVRARRDEPLVVYSGCDRYGGHLYRFVGEASIHDPKDPANSQLLENGRLEVAKLQPDGTGSWVPLLTTTAVAPLAPSHFERFGYDQPTLVPHSDRNRAGAEKIRSDAELASYRNRFKALGDLYLGSGDEQMGAILIDAHLAANAVGASPMARPEDTELDPQTGDLLITFTSGGADAGGRADPALFHGPSAQPEWPYGWVMRLQDQPGNPQVPGGKFSWRMVATGGLPWEGGMGFANPDNLAIDQSGNIWMVTDRSTTNSELDVFGNNSCWLFPAKGVSAGKALLFATGPMESELCGPCFDQTESTLFLAVQHPGEDYGVHQRGDQEFQAFKLRDRGNQPFSQLRQVPLGSNWPSGIPGRLPRPGVVAITRLDGAALLG